MAKHKLSKEEQFHVDNIDYQINSIARVLSKINKFQLGDYLTAYELDPREDLPIGKLSVNSLGVTRKFQVVYVDSNGISHIKELNKSGKPSGSLHSQISMYSIDIDECDYNHFKDRDGKEMLPTLIVPNQNLKFQLDSDYVDALIMQDHTYSPMEETLAKSNLKDEIVKHNLNVKIDVSTNDAILEFMKTIKVGDVLWRSETTSMVVQSISSSDSFLNKSGTLKSSAGYSIGVELFVALDNKGKKFIGLSNYNSDGGACPVKAGVNLKFAKLYKEKPRSFTKEKKRM